MFSNNGTSYALHGKKRKRHQTTETPLTPFLNITPISSTHSQIDPEIAEMSLEEVKPSNELMDWDESDEDEDNYEEKEDEVEQDDIKKEQEEKNPVEASIVIPKDIQANLRTSTDRLANWIEAFKRSELLYITEKPFDYQLNSMGEFYENRQETSTPQAITFSIATGVGKTFLFGSIAIITREKTLIVCPSNILCKQTIDRLKQYAQKNNLPEEKMNEFNIRKIQPSPTKEGLINLFASNNCVVTTYAMLVRHLEKMPWSIIDSVVLDEAHRSFSEKRSKMVKAIMSKECNVYAYTATPNNRKIKRGKGSVTSCEELLNYPKNIITSLGFREAIDIGANVPIVTGLIQIEGIELKLEQKNTEREISEVLAGNQLNQLDEQKKDIYAAIVEVYMNGGDSENDAGEKIWHRGQQCICFCPGIASAKKLAKRFREKITNLDLVDPDESLRKAYEKNRKNTQLGEFCIAKSVNSKLDKHKSEQIITQYRAGGILILTGADMLIEGFDNPRTSIIINLRPTKSEIIKIQSCGRGFRKDKDDNIRQEKICYVYDLYWGNTDCLYFFQYLETERHKYQFHWGDVNTRRKKLLENKRHLYKKFFVVPITDTADKIKIIRNAEAAATIIRGLRTKSDKTYQKNGSKVSMSSDYQHEIGWYSPVSAEFKNIFDEIENLDESLKTINEKFSGYDLHDKKSVTMNEEKKSLERPTKKSRESRELILTPTDIQERLINQSSIVRYLLEDMFLIARKDNNESKCTEKTRSKKFPPKKINTQEIEKVLKKYQELIQTITDRFDCLSDPTIVVSFNDSSGNELEKLKNLIKNLSYNLLVHRRDIVKKLHQDKIDQWIKNHNKRGLIQIIKDFCYVNINKQGGEEFEKEHAISIKNVKLIRGIIKSLASKDFKGSSLFSHSMHSQDDYSEGSQEESSEEPKQLYEFPALINYVREFRGKYFQYKIEILEDLLSVVPDNIALDLIRDEYQGTPLHALIRDLKPEVDIDFFILLLNRVNDINCVDQDLNSCLHGAAFEEKKLEWPTAQLLLLTMKANPNLKNKIGKTPASISKESPCRGMYLKHAKGMLTCDQNGRHILHHVLKNVNLNFNTVKKLIDAKAAVDVKDNKKMAPIMYIPTINRTNLNIFQLLLEKKADINSQNSDNETHLHLLFKNFYQETKDLGSNYHARNSKFLNPFEKVRLFSQLHNINANLTLRNSSLMTPLEIIYQQFNLLFDFLKPHRFKNRLKIKSLIQCFQIIKNLNVIPNDAKSPALDQLQNAIDILNTEFKPLTLNRPVDEIKMPDNQLTSPLSDLRLNSITPVHHLEDLKLEPEAYYRSIAFASSPSLPASPTVRIPTHGPHEIKQQHSEVEDNDNLIHIGQWGEYFIYQKLRQHYRDKYQGNINEYFPPRILTNFEAKEYKGFKGFKLAGIQKNGLRQSKVFISVEWLNMWPKECDQLMERKKYEKYENMDMRITKRRAYDIFLLGRLPDDYDLKANFVNTYIFIFSVLRQSIKLFYINKNADYRERTSTINTSVVLTLVKQYMEIMKESWEGLVEEKNAKIKFMQQISAESDGKFIKKERYIEIKSTSWLGKHGTIFKQNQCNAMREYKEKYCIYRVFGVPNINEADIENPVNKPKINKIKDPYKKILESQLNFSSITLEI